MLTNSEIWEIEENGDKIKRIREEYLWESKSTIFKLKDEIKRFGNSEGRVDRLKSYEEEYEKIKDLGYGKERREFWIKNLSEEILRIERGEGRFSKKLKEIKGGEEMAINQLRATIDSHKNEGKEGKESVSREECIIM